MNKIVELIKQAARMQMRPRFVTGLDPDKDEKKSRDLLLNSQWGSGWKVTSDDNKWERWDIEGYDPHDTVTRIEVKSRPSAKGDKYDTWIIDMYKIDHMVGEFPYDANYFLNACDGRFEIYDMRWIQDNCKFRKGVWSWMTDGSKEKRDFYYVPKDMFLIELGTMELGKGSEINSIFRTDES